MYKKILLYICIAFSAAACTKKTYIADVTSRTYRIEKGSYTNDLLISDMIAPYKEELDKTMNEVIGQNEAEMTKGKPNSSLTNWFADAIWEEVNAQPGLKADFAVQNYGGVRVNSVAAGPVTIGSVYELMPFDNTLYILSMTGAEVQMLFDKIAESNGWPVSRSVSFTTEFGKAAGLKINNKEIDLDAVYQVAMPDYVANGGDNMDFLKDCPKVETGKLVRDILISYVKRQTAQGRILKADMTPRIKESGKN